MKDFKVELGNKDQGTKSTYLLKNMEFFVFI